MNPVWLWVLAGLGATTLAVIVIGLAAHVRDWRRDE
jgi:hypothetical protein